MALTRDRVLDAAVTLADTDGIDGLSMRKLGQALGVEAMSLYRHVANKDAILDGIVDRVVGEIAMVDHDGDWHATMADRARSMRRVLLRHPWAPVLIESRMDPGPARLRFFDWTIGVSRRAGFSIEAAYNTGLVMDSYIYGFVLQEIAWPFDLDERADVVEEMEPQVPANKFPHLAEMMAYVMSADRHTAGREPYETEFESGLGLVLDGLQRAFAG